MRCDLHDHELVQCDVPWPVCLGGVPHDRVVMRAGEHTVHATLDAEGRATAWLPPIPAGSAFELVVEHAAGRHVASDLLAGDRWVCSGQSNMAMTLASTSDAESITRAGDQFNLRLCTVERSIALEPAQEAVLSWCRSEPETAGSFSAVGYYFGSTLASRSQRPIGMINASVGASPAEAWTPIPALQAVPRFAPIFERWRECLEREAADPDAAAAHYENLFVEWDRETDAAERAGRGLPGPQPRYIPRGHQWTPAGLFNGMIAPLTRKPVRGVVWYQAEAAPERASQYGESIRTLIRAWRDAWRSPDLPFIFVQVARFGPRRDTPCEHSWAELREAQTAALEEPATGMAVAIDTGDAAEIHPPDKRPIGERLAAEAMAIVYGAADQPRPPRVVDIRFEGPRAVVRFDAPLTTRDDQPARGFALSAGCGDTRSGNRGFHFAEASLQGDIATVTAEAVSRPVAVRYAWAQNPDCNLTSAAGLPVPPFRSDNWPGVTVGIE